MAVDPEYLRRHYASLSDEALLNIEPDDLVDAARECYDAEVSRRELDAPVESLDSDDLADANALDDAHEPGLDREPDWIEDGAEVYSAMVRAGVAMSPDAANARAALEAAGIPCHLDMFEEEPVEPEPPGPTHRWRLLVPGNLNLQATGILQRDIFNDDFEAGWRTQLEVLSDREVRAMNPRVVFCGLFDQIERVTRAYAEELSRRRLT